MSTPTWQSEDGSVQLYCGDCLEVLPGLGKVDAVVTDPPYGCDKASWDEKFFGAWYPIARRISPRAVIITGSVGLKDSLAMVGDDAIDVIAARNLNGMTRGPLGFGNWIAAVFVGKKPRQGPNAFDFVVNGKMPEHPSPKPIQYMDKLIARVSEPGDTICDPMFGSGTTGVACVRTGRKFIGIEISEQYFEIAKTRIQKAIIEKSEQLIPA